MTAKLAKRRVDTDEDRAADVSVDHAFEMGDRALGLSQVDVSNGDREVFRWVTRGVERLQQLQPFSPVCIPAALLQRREQLGTIDADAPTRLFIHQPNGVFVASDRFV